MTQELYFVPQSVSRSQNQMNTCVSLRYDTKTEELQLIDSFGSVKTISIDTTQDIQLEDIPNIITVDYVKNLGFETAEETEAKMPIIQADYGLDLSVEGTTNTLSLKKDVVTGIVQQTLGDYVDANTIIVSNDVIGINTDWLSTFFKDNLNEKVEAGYGIGIDFNEEQRKNIISLTAHIPSSVCDVWTDTQNVKDISGLGFALTSAIPTGLSQLTDDVGYLTIDSFLREATYVKAYPSAAADGGYVVIDEELDSDLVSIIKNNIGIIDAEVTTGDQLAEKYGAKFERFLRLVFATKNSSGKHNVDDIVYINVTELFDGYTAGTGINIADNVISINASISDLTNDSDFATSAYVDEQVDASKDEISAFTEETYVRKDQAPTDLSAFTNSVGYLTTDFYLKEATYVKAVPFESADNGYIEINANMTNDEVTTVKGVVGILDDEVTTAEQLIAKYDVKFKRYLKLIFVTKDNDGNETVRNTAYIDVNELFENYVAGEGIAITDNVVSLTAHLPTNVSELTNDAGFITGIENNALISDIPTDLSAFTNSPGYLTGYNDQFLKSATYVKAYQHPDVAGGYSDITTDMTEADVAMAKGAISVVDDEVTTAEQLIDKYGSKFERFLKLVFATKDEAGNEIINDPIYINITELFAGYKAGTGIAINDNVVSLTAHIPTNVSELTNDAGYLTDNTTYSSDGSTIKLNTETRQFSVYNLISRLAAGANISIISDDSGITQIAAIDTTYTAGEGLKLDGTEFSLTAAIPQGLNNWKSADNKQYISNIGFALKEELPTKVSEFENDSDFATNAYVDEQVEAGKVAVSSYSEETYLKQADAPTDLSAFTNSPGYLIQDDISDYALKSEIPTSNSGLTNDAGYITGIENNALLSDIPTGLNDWSVAENKKYISGIGFALTSQIPVNISELVNDAGYLTNDNFLKEAVYVKAYAHPDVAGGYVDITTDMTEADVAMAKGVIGVADDTVTTGEQLIEKYGAKFDRFLKLSFATKDINNAETVSDPIYINVTELFAGYKAGTGIAITDNVISINAAISDLTNDSEFATSAQVREIVEGYDYATNTTANGISDRVLTIENDYLKAENIAEMATTGYVTGVVNELATGAVATNTTNIGLIDNRVSAIEADYLKAENIAQMATTGYVTGVVNVATTNITTGQINPLTGRVQAIEDDYTTSAQVGEIVESYGYITGIENNALLSDVILTGVTVNNSSEITLNNKVANITIPTKVSDLTNDSGFITSDKFLKSADYVAGTLDGETFTASDDPNADRFLKLIFAVSGSVTEENTVYINVNDLFNGYHDGDGLTLDNNTFSLDVAYAKEHVASGWIASVPGRIQLAEKTVATLSSSDAINVIANDLSGINVDINTATVGTGPFTKTYIVLSTAAIPTNVGAFDNDAGYLTDIPTSYAQLSDIPAAPVIPTKVSELNNDKSFVTLADLETVKATLLKVMIPTNMSVYTTVEGNVNEPDKNIFIASNDTLTSNTTFVGDNVTVTELNNENSYTKFTATGDVTVSNLENSGTLPKATSNAQIQITTPGRVVITDSTVAQNGYNAIEIGNSSTTFPKSVLIDGVNFTGNLSNNAVNIFGTADDAVVTISNCTFAKVSNAIRLSNRTNASGVIINIENCQFTEWEHTQMDYAGMILCQDYTSQTAEEVASNNLFGNGKIIINIINCTYAGTKIEFSDPTTVCGSADANQILYVYADKVGVIAYDANKYPIITAQ